MTDEGFIRSIVEHPDEETPRLVYADWLDERDDPRGAYLRAEMQWAKPWQRGKPPREDRKLQAMASRLDAVWVARVSRPPMGVMCDTRLQFTEQGPPLTDERIDEFERDLQILVPPEYRALLLNWNGGCPIPSFYVPEGQPGTFAFVERFQTLHRETRTRKFWTKSPDWDLEASTAILHNALAEGPRERALWKRREWHFLPLAAVDQGFLALGLTGPRSGKIYSLNRRVLAACSAPRLVAPSLPAFLMMFSDEEL